MRRMVLEYKFTEGIVLKVVGNTKTRTRPLLIISVVIMVHLNRAECSSMCILIEVRKVIK